MHQRQQERRGVRHVALIKPEQFAPARIMGNPVGEQIPVPHALADGGQDVGKLGLVVAEAASWRMRSLMSQANPSVPTMRPSRLRTGAL
jgi:hypothetical protein